MYIYMVLCFPVFSVALVTTNEIIHLGGTKPVPEFFSGNKPGGLLTFLSKTLIKLWIGK